MKELTKEELINLEEHINYLEMTVGLNESTMRDLRSSINQARALIKMKESLGKYYSTFGFTDEEVATAAKEIQAVNESQSQSQITLFDFRSWMVGLMSEIFKLSYKDSIDVNRLDKASSEIIRFCKEKKLLRNDVL